MELLGQIWGERWLENLPGKVFGKWGLRCVICFCRNRERELIVATIHESGASTSARGNVVRSSALYGSYELCPLTDSQRLRRQIARLESNLAERPKSALNTLRLFLLLILTCLLLFNMPVLASLCMPLTWQNSTMKHSSPRALGTDQSEWVLWLTMAVYELFCINTELRGDSLNSL